MIEIAAVGGYGEVGRNCTAVRVDDEVIILDMGIHLEHYIEFTNDEDIHYYTYKELIAADAIPNIYSIEDWKEKVKAIVCGHAHLDHIGAVPYLANKVDKQIICTPFTGAVIKAISRDEKIKLKVPIRIVNSNSKYEISDNIRIEFINATHSTPQTVHVAIHTKYGIILYSNDFKLDNSPLIERKTNYERLKELGDQGKIIALIGECLYSWNPQKCPSENIAKQMLSDVLLETDTKGKAVIVTTFSSHIARIKTMVELGHKMGRKVVILGRSLSKYMRAAQEVGLAPFLKGVKMIKYREEVAKFLKRANFEKDKYLLIVTGHQGEPKALLSRIIRKEIPFDLKQNDVVVFSCQVIPAEINIKNREALEEELKRLKVRIFRDVHVSGHAFREDLRDFIKITKPKHIFPTHGNKKMTDAYLELAKEEGYNDNNIIILKNKQRKTLEI
ncbi:MAG: RNase J family beta-CASP ribonuclease [Candidatus Woesearchaeota archaeon]